MEKSQSIANIAKALINFHQKVSKIKKDSSNPFFKSNYASLSNILDSIGVPLIESGLSYVQFPTNGYGLTTLLMHGESGEYIQDTYEMKPTKDDPQGRGSVITYQRRYALGAILGLNIDDDDDGNAGSEKVKEQPQNTPSNKPTSMSKAQFEQACERIKAGDKTVYQKAVESFTLTAAQVTQLDQLHKSLN